MISKLKTYFSKKKSNDLTGVNSSLLSWNTAKEYRPFSYVFDPDVVLQAAGKKRGSLKILLTDSDIGPAVNTRRDALKVSSWALDPSEGALALKIWDNLNDMMPDILNCAFDALLYGFSVSERVYGIDEDGFIYLKGIRSCPVDDFVFDAKDQLKKYDKNSGLHELVDIDYKYLLVRNYPTVENPYGESLLTTLYWPWVFKNNNIRFMLQFLERCGNPMLVGRSETDTQRLFTELKSAYSNYILAVDKSTDVTLLAPPQGQNKHFCDTDELFVKKILIQILGQTLTSSTDGSSGNRALGVVHDGVRKEKREADAKLVQPGVQNIVDALTHLNNSNERPPYIFFSDENSLEVERAQRDSLLIHHPNFTFTRKYYEDMYNLDAEHFAVVDAPISNDSTTTKPASTNKQSTTINELEIASLNFLELTKVLQEAQNDARQLDLIVSNLVEAGLTITEKDLKACFEVTDEIEIRARLTKLLEPLVQSNLIQKEIQKALLTSTIIGFVGGV